MIKNAIKKVLSIICRMKYNMQGRGADYWVNACINDYKEKIVSFKEIRD